MKIDDFNLSLAQKSSLRSYAENNKFPQTVLIRGGDIKMRMDFARLLSEMIVCESDGEKPCGACAACRKCASGNHPDIKEYGEEKANYIFKVDLSREIRADAFVIPNDSDKKVYIIKEAQNMNDSAGNALLKILEEPPSFDFFILTCENSSAVLGTILSRASLITLGESETRITPENAALAEKIAAAVIARDELELCESLAPLSSKKDAFLETTLCLEKIFTDCIIYKQTGANYSEFAALIKTLCERLTVRRLYTLAEAAENLKKQFNMNANYNLLLTEACVLLRAAAEK